LLLGLALACSGQGPHELLVLVNRNSTGSVAVAETFVRLRQVPRLNVVELDVPNVHWRESIQISPARFTKYIWGPASAAAQKRGIDDHILAWVYSTDFPVRVTCEPPFSLLGMTFLRNRRLDIESIRLPAEVAKQLHQKAQGLILRVKLGWYMSPLFAGPGWPGALAYPPVSLDAQAARLRTEMPLPSMMLGYTGTNGNTQAEIVACLRRGLESDGTRPEGTVYYLSGRTNQVRAVIRRWQFPGACRELARFGVDGVVTDRFPTGADRVIGLMMGAATVRPARIRKFVPGAMAEHLTSLAAAFDAARPPQTKLTEWIRAGATASAGTVSEPRSMWQKFPHARFFAHYASGCTMLESFYQAVFSPLQTLFVGEPLAAPWRPLDVLRIRGPDTPTVSGQVAFSAHVQAADGREYSDFVCLLDGRVVGPPVADPQLTLDTTGMNNGQHTIRIVGRLSGPVRTQVFAVKRFVVRNAAPARRRLPWQRKGK